MKTLKIVACAVLCMYLVPPLVHSGDFDGSKSLLFSVTSVIECEPNGECNPTTTEDMNLPQFMKIDFVKKIIIPLTPNAGKRYTVIRRMESLDGKLILQGIEKGSENERESLGWTMTISEKTGKAVVTASAEDVAFVIFGACLNRKISRKFKERYPL